MQWNCKYVPTLKTSDAELRALRELSDEQKSKFIPLFELTKSRRTKKDRIGKISKRLDTIKDIMGDKPFILDLMTSHESMMNTEIENLLDEYDGFEAWFNFVVEHKKELNLIPTIHVVPDELHEVTKLTNKLAQEFDCLAFRLEAEDDDASLYLEAIKNGIPLESHVSLIVIIDANYLDSRVPLDYIQDKIENRISELNATGIPSSAVVISSSSFPSSVTDVAGDKHGKIPQIEKTLFANIRHKDFMHNLVYGDYASVHPIKYDVGGYGWVPRVDISTSSEYIYHRYRRESGGYISAADKMIHDPNYENINVWGNEQILKASEGDPNGLSPSFWISVRINIHISRILLDLYE
jgi:hypothetical protein